MVFCGRMDLGGVVANNGRWVGGADYSILALETRLRIEVVSYMSRAV
jgi:hypothetical protein